MKLGYLVKRLKKTGINVYKDTGRTMICKKANKIDIIGKRLKIGR